MKVWLSKNNEKDEKDITMIMESIRFGLLEHNFFHDKVNPVLESLFPYFTISCNWNIRAEPRCPESLLFTFGGRQLWGGLMSTISVMDPAAAKWTDLSISLPSGWAYMDTVVVDTDVFLCGGLIENVSSRMFMKFNPNTMEISRLSKMKEHRNFVSLATHKENICIASQPTSPFSSGPVHYNTGPADIIQKYGTGPSDSVPSYLNCYIAAYCALPGQLR